MLKYWITKYQKSCDHPYWLHWKPSLYGNLGADTIFQKSGFHLIAGIAELKSSQPCWEMVEPSSSRAQSLAVSFTVKKCPFLGSGQIQFICHFFFQIRMLFYGREGVCFSHNCTCQENDSEQHSLLKQTCSLLASVQNAKGVCFRAKAPHCFIEVFHTGARDS